MKPIQNAMLLALVAMMTAGALSAQQQQETKVHQKGLKISSASMGQNLLFIHHQGPGFEELKALGGDHSALFPDLSGYDSYTPSYNNVTRMYATLNMNPYSKKKESYNRNREIEAMLIMSNGRRSGHSFHRNRWETGDTLYSASQTLYSDTLFSSGYYYDLYIKDLSLGLGYLLRTDPARRISAYYGLRVSSGLSMKEEITVFHHEDTVMFYGDSPEELLHGGNRINTEPFHERATIPTEKSVLTKLEIPAGVSYRVSKKVPFLNRVHVTLNGMVGVESQTILDHSTYVRPYWGAGINFRYSFHDLEG